MGDAQRTGERYLIAGGSSLLAAMLVGGLVLSGVERLALEEGLWLAFSTVSTLGYEAPATPAGRGVVFLMFVWAMMSYMLVVAGVIIRVRGAAWLAQKGSAADSIPEDDVRRILASIRMN